MNENAPNFDQLLDIYNQALTEYPELKQIIKAHRDIQLSLIQRAEELRQKSQALLVSSPKSTQELEEAIRKGEALFQEIELIQELLREVSKIS